MCSKLKMRILVAILLLLGSIFVDGYTTNAPEVQKIVNKRVHDDIIKRGKNLKLYSCKFKTDTPEGKKKYKCKPVKAVDELDNSLAGLKLSEKVTQHDVIKLAGIDKFAPWVLDVLKTPPRETSFVNVPVEGTTIPPHPEDLLIDHYAPYDGTSFDNFNYEYEYYNGEELGSKEEIIEQATSDVKNIFDFKDKLEDKARSILPKTNKVKRSSGEEKDAKNLRRDDDSDNESVAKQAPEQKAPEQKAPEQPVAAASESKSVEEKYAELRKQYPEFYANLGGTMQDKQKKDYSDDEGPDYYGNAEAEEDDYSYDTNEVDDYSDSSNAKEKGNSQGDRDRKAKGEDNYWDGQDYDYQGDYSDELDEGRYNEQVPRGRYGKQQGRRGHSGGQQGQGGQYDAQQRQGGRHGGQQAQGGRYDEQHAQGGRYGGQQGQGGRYGGKQGGNANYERKMPNDNQYKDMYINSASHQQFGQQQQQQQQPQQKQQPEQQQTPYYQDYGSYDYETGSDGQSSIAQGSAYNSGLEDSYYSMDPYVTAAPAPVEAKQLPSTPSPYGQNTQQPDPYMSYNAFQNPSYQTPQAYQHPKSATPAAGGYTQKPTQNTAALLNALFSETGSSSAESHGIASPYHSKETSYQYPYGDYYAGEYEHYDNTVDPEYQALAQQLAQLTSQIKDMSNHQTLQQQKQMMELQKQQQDIIQQKIVLAQQQQEIERQRLELEKQKVLEEQKRQALEEQQRQQALLQQQELERQTMYQMQEQQQYAIAQYSPTATPSPYKNSVVGAPISQPPGHAQGNRPAPRMAGARQLETQYQGAEVEAVGGRGDDRPRATARRGGRGPRRRFGGARGQGRPGAAGRRGPATGGLRGRFMGRRPRPGGRAGGRFGPQRHAQAPEDEEPVVSYEDLEGEEEGGDDEGYGPNVQVKYKYVTVNKDGSEVSADGDYSYDDESPVIDDEEIIGYNSVIGEDGEVYQELGPVPTEPPMMRGGGRRGPRMGYPGRRQRRPMGPRY